MLLVLDLIISRRACDRSTRRITVDGYAVTICNLMQLGAARSDVTGLGLEKQPKVALGELS
jgi:hypothetical protein